MKMGKHLLGEPGRQPLPDGRSGTSHKSSGTWELEIRRSEVNCASPKRCGFTLAFLRAAGVLLSHSVTRASLRAFSSEPSQPSQKSCPRVDKVRPKSWRACMGTINRAGTNPTMSVRRSALLGRCSSCYFLAACTQTRRIIPQLLLSLALKHCSLEYRQL